MEPSSLVGIYYILGGWIATWKENGKQRSEYFSVRKYGEGAKSLALAKAFSSIKED